MPLHLLDNLTNLSNPNLAKTALGLGTENSVTFAALSVTGTGTVSGNWVFSSPTRPTSLGTGALSANSLITSTDGARRYMSHLRAVQLDLQIGWTGATTTGGSIAGGNNYLRLEAANGTTAGACTGYLTAQRNGIGVQPAGNFSGIDFTAPVAANFAFRTRNFNIASSLNWAFIFGNHETAAAGLSSMIKSGTNTGIGWVGLQCLSGNVTLIAVNGTSAVGESGTIDTCIDGYNQKGYRIEVQSGVAYCYDSLGLLLGSLSTNVPTTKKEFSTAILVQASSATPAQLGIIVQHASFDW